MTSSHHNTDSNNPFAGQKFRHNRIALIVSILIVLIMISLTACSDDEATRKSRSGRWTKVDDTTTLVAYHINEQAAQLSIA